MLTSQQRVFRFRRQMGELWDFFVSPKPQNKFPSERLLCVQGHEQLQRPLPKTAGRLHGPLTGCTPVLKCGQLTSQARSGVRKEKDCPASSPNMGCRCGKGPCGLPARRAALGTEVERVDPRRLSGPLTSGQTSNVTGHCIHEHLFSCYLEGKTLHPLSFKAIWGRGLPAQLSPIHS